MTGKGAIAPHEVVTWVEAAQPGESKVYAWGDDRLPALPGVAVVKRLRDEGRVTCVARKLSPGRFEYLIQRIAVRAQRELEIAARRKQAQETAVMIALRRAAADRSPCPTDQRLADVADLVTPEEAAAILSRLRGKGLIFVQYEGPHKSRVVMIRSSGARTKRERRA